MRARAMLVTGFQAYGGRGINPAQEIAQALDGERIDGTTVAGRVLPASFHKLRGAVEELVGELRPRVLVCLGLWPGEPMLRIERVAFNHAAFEIADNEGVLEKDAPLDPGGPVARRATLPVTSIVEALLRHGIPARHSTTAGSFLCNALMYHALGAVDTLAPGAKAGFVHVPYVPAQVALLQQDLTAKAELELHQRADLASMALDLQIDAVRTTLRVSQAA